MRAIVYVAEHGREGPCRAQDIAEGTEIPANYLSKILHRLGRHGLLGSVRGRYGGFRLARAPDEIRLAEVIAPFGSFNDPGRCLLGRPECSDESPCGAHQRWKKARAEMSAFFAGTTLEDVLGSREPADNGSGTPTTRGMK